MSTGRLRDKLLLPKEFSIKEPLTIILNGQRFEGCRLMSYNIEYGIVKHIERGMVAGLEYNGHTDAYATFQLQGGAVVSVRGDFDIESA